MLIPVRDNLSGERNVKYHLLDDGLRQYLRNRLSDNANSDDS